MNTLEDDINEIIHGSHEHGLPSPIEDWLWTGLVMMGGVDEYQDSYIALHELIERADLAVCLTSTSAYIRGYRTWYEKVHTERNLVENAYNFRRRYEYLRRVN